MRLVQLQRGLERRVARVDEPRLCLLDPKAESVWSLVRMALAGGVRMEELVGAACRESVEYDPIYAGESEWKLLVPFDHPTEPGCVSVAGTGLTHVGSAKSRNAMHGKESKNTGGDAAAAPETDSMKMFRWGVEGGKPGAGKVGIAPEWFYKGNGTVLRAHNEPLDVPAFGEDGGEEAEIVGIYMIAADGTPVRVGMAQGNEFSDHLFEKKNYLNLAGSKLRTCSVGPGW